jgi:glycosyltransferase involved in cell wall biosynthesis
MTPVSLAVIVIARNEEQIVQECLSACLEAVRLATEADLVASAEVVLVDSASEDRTREIAATFPVRILAIPSYWPLSAAAGRYVGMRHTASEVVLFVDADFVLDPVWLPGALREFTDPTVAGVCGVDRESLQGTNMISRYVAELTARSTPTGVRSEAEGIAVGLYRRDWIERAGGVQPFLKGAEDRDLALRVRALGGRLVKTRAVMGFHHWTPGEDLNLTEYFRSVARWSFGEGQAARHAIREPLIRSFYFKRYFNLRHLIQLELALVLFTWCLGLLVTAVTSRPVVLAGLLAIGLATLAGTARLRSETVRETLFRLHQGAYAIIRIGGFLLGTAKRTRRADEYPSCLPG